MRERDPLEYELQIHQRFAMPVAPLLFTLVGVPLGIRQGRSARSTGALLCALVAFAYHALYVTGRYLALQHWVAPALALWVPNVAFAVLALVLLARARRVVR